MIFFHYESEFKNNNIIYFYYWGGGSGWRGVERVGGRE